MNYTLNQLQVFLTVARTQSVTKAAEELSLTQPAVSIQLRNFQDQFDLPLTEVVGRKIYITDFGREIAALADEIIGKVESINHKTSQYKGQLSGKLRLAVVSTGKYVMPYFLSDFTRLNREVDLEMDVTNKAKVLDSLKRNAVDFALVSILPEKMQVNKVDLVENKLYLVGNRESEVASSNLKQLFKELPLIFRENGSGTRQVMEGFIQRHHLLPRKKIELTTNEAVKQAVIAGLGFSIMPIIGIKSEVASGDIKVFPIKGLPIQTTWSLIWLKDKKLSPVAQAYLEHIKANKQQISKRYFGSID